MALSSKIHGVRSIAVCPGPIEGYRIEQVMVEHARTATQVEGRSTAQIRTEIVWCYRDRRS